MSEVTQDYLNTQWYAMPEDTIGGWCVKINEISPSQSPGGEVALFISEEVAKHIANIHNTWLFYKQRRPKRYHGIL
jgi:hypothetical protein